MKQWILDQGIDVNAKIPDEEMRTMNTLYLGFAPVHLASELGLLQVAEFLIDNGAEIDAISTWYYIGAYVFHPSSIIILPELKLTTA